MQCDAASPRELYAVPGETPSAFGFGRFLGRRRAIQARTRQVARSIEYIDLAVVEIGGMQERIAGISRYRKAGVDGAADVGVRRGPPGGAGERTGKGRCHQTLMEILE